MLRKTIAIALLAIGFWTMIAFTRSIRSVMTGAMSDWVRSHYEGLPEADEPMAYFSAFWESGGWGWIGLLGLFALPGMFIALGGAALLLPAINKKQEAVPCVTGSIP